jgi:hypothetical protein
VALLAAAVAALTFLSKRQHTPPSPPFGVELSQTPGVSIIRLASPDGGSSTSNGGGGAGDSPYSLDMRNYPLLDALNDVADGDFPILNAGALPEGFYHVKTHVNTGGKQRALDLLCEAYSKACGLSVARKEVMADVLVMTCPDRGKLKLSLATKDQPRGFPHNISNTRVTCPFVASTKELAWYASYMTRKFANWDRDPEIMRRVLTTDIVDETGLEGAFTAVLAWDLPVTAHSSPAAAGPAIGTQPKTITGPIGALQDAGFTLTPAQRIVQAIVIEPARPASQPATQPAEHGTGARLDFRIAAQIGSDDDKPQENCISRVRGAGVHSNAVGRWPPGRHTCGLCVV